MEVYRAPSEIHLPSGLIIPTAIELNLTPEDANVRLSYSEKTVRRYVMSAQHRYGLNVASFYLAEDDFIRDGMVQDQISSNIILLSTAGFLNGFDITQADRFFSPLELELINHYNPGRGRVFHDHH